VRVRKLPFTFDPLTHIVERERERERESLNIFSIFVRFLIIYTFNHLHNSNMPWNIFRRTKVSPEVFETSDRNQKKEDGALDPPLPMKVVRLHTVLKRYGGQRHPHIEMYDTFKKRDELVEWRYVPSEATVIYISHEWVGTSHPDPDGTQMYHLLLMLERLQQGDVSKTELDAVHTLIYKQNFVIQSADWKQILRPEKTFLWYVYVFSHPSITYSLQLNKTQV
jgi:hypothetical protein